VNVTPQDTGAAELERSPDDLLDGWDAAGARKPQKRSMTIAGHRTSISLEEPFWRGLKDIARLKGASIASLVAAIDAVRGDVSLSTAIRLYTFEQAAKRRGNED
jgi:predicted DNA-binding ribbon-helix-helix protein